MRIFGDAGASTPCLSPRRLPSSAFGGMAFDCCRRRRCCCCCKVCSDRDLSIIVRVRKDGKEKEKEEEEEARCACQIVDPVSILFAEYAKEKKPTTNDHYQLGTHTLSLTHTLTHTHTPNQLTQLTHTHSFLFCTTLKQFSCIHLPRVSTGPVCVCVQSVTDICNRSEDVRT